MKRSNDDFELRPGFDRPGKLYNQCLAVLPIINPATLEKRLKRNTTYQTMTFTCKPIAGRCAYPLSQQCTPSQYLVLSFCPTR